MAMQPASLVTPPIGTYQHQFSSFYIVFNSLLIPQVRVCFIHFVNKYDKPIRIFITSDTNISKIRRLKKGINSPKCCLLALENTERTRVKLNLRLRPRLALGYKSVARSAGRSLDHSNHSYLMIARGLSACIYHITP